MNETERQIVELLNAQVAEAHGAAGKYGERGIWHLAADYDRQAKMLGQIASQIERGEHRQRDSAGED